MKKVLVVLLVAMLVFSAMACSAQPAAEESPSASESVAESASESASEEASAPEESESSGEPAAGGSDELIIYGWAGNWDLWFADWAKEFEEETGIKIKYISGQGTAMRERIIAEEAAQSDILISTPGDAFLLANEGWLADIPYDDIPSAADVDEAFKYPQVCIWGYDIYTIAFNPDYISMEETPSTWKELADPEWAGQLGMPLVTDDTASRPAMILENAYGRDEMLTILQSMYDNSSVLFDTPGRMESAIATGQCMISPLSLGNCNVVMNEAGGNVQLLNPEEGCLMMLNSMTIMKNAPNYDAAVKFMEFYLSPERQNNIMNELGISIAVNNTVEMNSEALTAPLGDLTLDDIMSDALFPDWEGLMVMNEEGVTGYEELMNAMAEQIKS